MTHPLAWKKYHPLSDKNAFICLVDVMGDDSSIVQAARVSYGKDEQAAVMELDAIEGPEVREAAIQKAEKELASKDRQLIRYLMNHSHTTPFEMVEIKFMVQVPMDCWRQWIRHRTANVNEYSTRYTEALDMQQTTLPGEWRLQATDNKQGSSGFLEEWPEGIDKSELPFVPGQSIVDMTPGEYLTRAESWYNKMTQLMYQARLQFGIAKEQARKDLPLSTYTRAYWKCDLHNILNFLRLRMDSHAQLEIRSFANAMFEIVKQICPVACEAFEDYVLHSKKFSRMEMEVMRILASRAVEHRDIMQEFSYDGTLSREDAEKEWSGRLKQAITETINKPNNMSDREWKEFLAKLS